MANRGVQATRNGKPASMATEKTLPRSEDRRVERGHVVRYAVAGMTGTALFGVATGLMWWLGPMSLTLVLGAATFFCFTATAWMAYDLRADPPWSSPNLDEDHPGAPIAQPLPADTREHRADRAMAEAEQAVSLGAGTELQRRRVRMMRRSRSHEGRRATWLLGERR